MPKVEVNKSTLKGNILNKFLQVVRMHGAFVLKMELKNMEKLQMEETFMEKDNFMKLKLKEAKMQGWSTWFAKKERGIMPGTLCPRWTMA